MKTRFSQFANQCSQFYCHLTVISVINMPRKRPYYNKERTLIPPKQTFFLQILYHAKQLNSCQLQLNPGNSTGALSFFVNTVRAAVSDSRDIMREYPKQRNEGKISFYRSRHAAVSI